MRERLLTALLLLLVATAPALAGVKKGNGELGFDFGLADLDSDLTGESGARFTLRGGYHISDWFQIEAMDAGMAADGSPLGSSTGDTLIGAFFINGVFNFHPGKGSVVPYVLVGLGLATVRIDLPGGELEDTGGASQFAAGSRFFFGKTKRTAVRVEAGVMRHDTSDLFINEDESFSETWLTAGFTWRLGSEK